MAEAARTLSRGGTAGSGQLLSWGTGVVTTQAPLEHPQARRLGARAAVLLCADPTVGDGAALGDVLWQALREALPEVPIVVVADVCSGSRCSKDLLGEMCAQQVVVVCRQGRARRDEIVAQLRRVGVHPAGIAIVDLAAPEGPDVRRAAEECAVRIEAALALVSAADLSVASREKIAFDAVRLSRRGLFRFATLASRPVVSWVEGRCDGTCHSCVTGCPQGALSLAGTTLRVDAERCTGCGVCLGACRTGALELRGVSVEGLERAANVLARGAHRFAPPGCVVVACSEARDVPHDHGWLPLEVPSLGMVTTGWVLQFLAAGLPVQLVGCDEEACGTRARVIVTFCAQLLEKIAPGGDRARTTANGVVIRPGLVPSQLLSITLREPQATISALSALQATASALGSATEPQPVAGPQLHWRVESSVSPLGELAVNSGACSRCGLCALSCPDGALIAEAGKSEFVLSFSASLCSACGACVSSCPETALSLQRVVDSTTLAANRHNLMESADTRRCRSCGEPMSEGLLVTAIASRLADSHPDVADRLVRSDRCADCMLQA